MKCFAHSFTFLPFYLFTFSKMCGASLSRVYDERKRRKVSVRQSVHCAVTSACAKYKSHSGQEMKKAYPSAM